jgi:hypothetical protein
MRGRVSQRGDDAKDLLELSRAGAALGGPEPSSAAGDMLSGARRMLRVAGGRDRPGEGSIPQRGYYQLDVNSATI